MAKKKHKDPSQPKPAKPADPVWTLRSIVACVAGWCLPGGGHLYLGARKRGLIGLAVVAILFVVGVLLDGELDTPRAGQILSYLGTFACLGVGPGYFVGVGPIDGVVTSASFEYGNTLLRTAGLLNMLLIIDAFDIAVGRKG